ncbi:polar amino acid transport system substrate-binding protein [Pelomonas saccharophila]|uniref:Polar amino acid transport system substrate-binding protein n=1 Tax=Roseateles saccharophilus TaxID=304 RepID=A0ABU1YR57_ROSSA|nr:transporter substrate-binding domain-containing protein [Roseateles saccharophilus]MDR7270710.1 polar amino acid transport system substrate-binding protein [Roseateles saccharophilus]
MPLTRRTCLALAATPLAARAAPEVVIALDTQNPPFMYAGRDGLPHGVYPLLLRTLFNQIDVPARLVCLPWPRALAGLERAEHGVGGIYATAERQARHDFSQALHVETLKVYTRRGGLRLFDRIEDLRGLRVGVLRGWSYGDSFDAAARAGAFGVEPVSSDSQNFGKLERGFLDVAVAIEQSGDALLVTGDYPSVRALPNPLTENPTYLAFNKTAQQRALIARFDESLDKLRRSGEHARIVSLGLRD